MAAWMNRVVNRAGWLMCGMLILLSLTGCGEAENQKTTMEQYADDGYMGFSTANPGMLTGPHSRTYVNTSRIVEQALEKVPGIVSSKIFYRGGTVIVRIRAAQELEPYGLSALQADALERLNAALPSYNVRVIVSQ